MWPKYSPEEEASENAGGSPAPEGGEPGTGETELPSYLIEDDDVGLGPADDPPAEPPADGDKGAPPAAATPPAETPPAPETPKAPEAAAAKPTAPTPPKEEAQSPAAAEPAKPVEPQAPQRSEAEVQAERQAQRTEFLSRLQSEYDKALDASDREALVTDPGSVLPKVAAQLHANVTEAVIYGVMTHLPRMIQDSFELRNRQQKDEDAYFSEWPELRTEQGMQVSARILRTYLQVNPNVSKETAIKEVGIAAMQALGLSRNAPPPPPPPPPPMAPSIGGPGASIPAPAPKGVVESFFEDIASEGRGL